MQEKTQQNIHQKGKVNNARKMTVSQIFKICFKMIENHSANQSARKTGSQTRCQDGERFIK